MHLFTIVLVPSDTQDIEAAVDALLEPYGEYKVVEVHKQYVEGLALKQMAESYGLQETDLEALAKHLKEYWGDRWGEEDARDASGIDERGLFFTVPVNPQAMWDYWHIGGRWDGVIQGKSRNTKGRSNYGPEHEQLQYNICPIAELAPDIFAWQLVTPDGQWHEGEWELANFDDDGTSEVSQRWRARLWELLEQHRDCIAVGVDCSF